MALLVVMGLSLPAKALVYQGLTNTALGNAVVAVSGGALDITNLGSSGQDGVSIALPGNLSALDVLCQDVDPSNALAVGEYVQSAVIGPVSGLTNGVLATVKMTKAGTANYPVTADFSALGTSNCLVQAYLDGILVGQATTNTQAGDVIVVLKVDDDGTSWDIEFDDENCYKASTIDCIDATAMVLPGGLKVYANKVWITPLNIPLIKPTAFQITASQVPVITIDSENVSLVYQGLTNTSLGNAALAISGSLSGSQLDITNLGSSGQDGVSIALNPGDSFAGGWQPLDASNSLPAGAYVQGQVIGTAGTITNGLLGSLTCTKTGTTNYAITVDYSPLGSSSYTVQVYNGANLVAQMTGQTGALCATVGLPPGTCTINPELNMEWPNPVTITIGGGAAGGGTTGGGTAVMGTEILVIPEGAASILSVSAEQIVAANIPSIVLTNEDEGPAFGFLVYQGLTNTSLGNAVMALAGSNDVITNLGSSGQDGLAIALPANQGLDVEWQPLDPSNLLPVGAYIEERVVGTADGITNEELGTVTMTKECAVCDGTNYLVSADFSAIGVSTYTVQAWLGGTLVAQATNQSGPALAYCSIWGDSGCIPPPPIMGGGWDWTNEGGATAIVGGASVSCDHLYVIPENVSGTPTAFQLTASQIPAITITSENQSLVYQGLTNTSLGSAVLAVSGSQLVISNLGSGGQDGVSVAMPPNAVGLVLSCPPSDGTNTPPNGAYFRGQVVGTANGIITNGVLGTLTVTFQSPTNFDVTADYSRIGASTMTVQAFLNGVLVAQVTGLSGPGIAAATAAPDSFDLGGIETPESLEWQKYTNILTIVGGPTVQCDRLVVTPEGAPTCMATAFQIVASQVPAFTLAAENESLVYQGLTNTSLGNASIALACCISNLGSGGQDGLVISNLGSSGQDGVSIALNPGDSFAGGWQPLDASNSLPAGAYVQGQIIGSAGTITNGLLGSLTCTKTGTTNYAITVDYSPLGSSSHTVQVYNGANLVAQMTGQTGSLCATTGLPPGTCTINPELNMEWPVPVAITIGGGTTGGGTTGGGASVTGTEILVIPEGAASILSVSAEQIVAANIPSITITNENEGPAFGTLVYQGLTNTTLGNAVVAVSGGDLYVTNLGSGGQDGVAIELQSGLLAVDVGWQEIDPSNVLPVGSYMQERIIGAADGINGTLGTVVMTKECAVCEGTNYLVSADFSPIGASTYTVQAYLNGALVAQATNQSGPALAYCNIWGDSGCIPPLPILGGGWDWTNEGGATAIVGGASVACDHLYIIAENVSGIPTALQLTASQIPAITITGENASLVYQGLTNTTLGNAALAVSGSQLVITNLGSSGQDGVSIALTSNLSALDVHWQALDASNTLPVGAYIRDSAVGTANGITNGVLGSCLVTKAGTTNYLVSADFSPLGTSNCLVQAYLAGELVGQATNSGGPSEIIIIFPFAPFSVDLEGPLEVKPLSLTLGWTSATDVTLTGGPTVSCDHVFISPLIASPCTLAAFQIVASQVPGLTITSENVSLVYQDLTNTSLGNAALAVSGSQLVITNLGSSGQDGVEIGIPGTLSGGGIRWLPLDPSNAAPAGAYLQEQIIGTFGSVTNGVLGTLTTTKAGAANYVMTADFTPIGVTNLLVQGYDETVLLGQTNLNGGPVFDLPICCPGPSTPQCDFDWHCCPWVFKQTHWTLTSSLFVGADTLATTPEGVSGLVFSAVKITASGFPFIIITNEDKEVTYAGLTNTSLGNAALAVSGSNLIVTNLGSSGQDGVAFALPNNSSALNVEWQPLDLSNTLPLGAYIQEQVVGTDDGMTNGVLGTVTVTKDCAVCDGSNYLVSADFSAIGASTFTVQAYFQGVLVAQATNQPGSILSWLRKLLPTSGDVEPDCCPVSVTVSLDWGGSGGDATVGDKEVMCDHLYITPENVTLESAPTAFQIVASQVPSLTMTAVTVSPLLVSLSRTGQGVTLQWFGTGVLQQSSDLENWSAISGAASPYAVQMSATIQFFRIMQPNP